MASRELNILVAAKGALKAARDIGSVDKSVSKLQGTAGRLAKGAAVGIGAGAVVGAAIISRGVKSGIESLALLEDATTQVQGAIDQAGIAGSTSAQQVATWANDIEGSVDAAFDDKDIVSATATLIRFGKVTPQNLRPAMEVMTDLAAKTGDVDSAAALLSKALADPAKAAGKLNRVGVILTKTQQDQIKAAVKAGDAYEAQEILLSALAETTKGAAAASAGPYRDSLNILTDVTEDAQRALGVGFLPVITKVRDILTRELAKPGTLKGIEDFGRGLAGGLEKLIDVAIGLPWDQIKTTFQVIGTGSKAMLDAFLGLPPWIQTAVLTAWGTNKITGGLVGELGKGLIKGVLGMTAAQVNITAANVTSTGGAPIGGGGTSLLGKGLQFVGGALLVTGAVTLATEISGVNSPNHQLPGFGENKFGGKTFRGTNVANEQISHLRRSLPVLEQRARSGDTVAQEQLATVRNEINRLIGVSASGSRDVTAAIAAGDTRSEMASLAAAIRDLKLDINVTVNGPSAADNSKADVKRKALVKPGGSRARRVQEFG